MSETIISIENAQNFDSLVQAFSDHFHINLDYWKESVEKGKDAIEKIEVAENVSNPIERAIHINSLFHNMPMYSDLELVGYTFDEFRRRIDTIIPKRDDGKPMSQGEVAYNEYFKAGSLPDGLSTSIKRLADIKSRTELIYREIHKIGQKNTDEYQARINQYYDLSGFDDLQKACDKKKADYDATRVSFFKSYEAGEITYEKYRDALEELNLAYQEYYIKYREDTKEIRKEANRLWDECNNLVAKETESYHAELEELEKEKKAFANEFYEKVVDEALNNSRITSEEAIKWAELQNIENSAIKRLKKMNYPVEQVQKDMAEFYRLTGGRIGKTTIVTKGHRRAQADVFGKTVFLDGNFNKRTLFHEMGHLLESHAHIKEMSNAFITKRTGGQSAIKSLRSLAKNSRYKSNEVAYEDDFFNPYVGKVYRDGITEVCSMGVQQFASPELMIELYGKDPEMFQLIYGMIKTPPSDFEQNASKVMLKYDLEQRERQNNAKDFYKALDKKAANIEQLIEGTYYTVESWKSNFRLKNPNRFTLSYNGKYIQSFKKLKELRRFLYLYLWMNMVAGKEAAENAIPEIAQDVWSETIPRHFFKDQKDWKIIDVKIPDEDRIKETA